MNLPNSSTLIFQQKRLKHAARLTNSTWLFILLGIPFSYLLLMQIDLIDEGKTIDFLILICFLGIFFFWPVYVNYFRFSVYIFEVNLTNSSLEIYYLKSDSEAVICIEKQRANIVCREISRAGIIHGIDYQMKIYQDGILILTAYDYPSITNKFYLEELAKKLKEFGIKVND